MADFTLSMRVSGQFFDRSAVQRRLSAAKRRNLSRAGAFVRRTARQSIRRSKKSAPAGRPPRAHSTDQAASLKKILFAYDAHRESVVIGPVKLNQAAGDGVPATLEKGGKTTIAVGPRKNRKKRVVNIAARPYMGPALSANQEKIAPMWRGSVK